MLHNYMFRPFLRPSSGCILLALRLMYPDDKYTNLIIRSQSLTTLVLLWWVCGQIAGPSDRAV